MDKGSFAIIVPMANEENDFNDFIRTLIQVLNTLGEGKVYLVTDLASTDRTPQLCSTLSQSDSRFIHHHEPANKNVVDAYLAGYRVAHLNRHDFYIEMDAGLSHQPSQLPQFLHFLNLKYDCVFGSRYMQGGSVSNSTFGRQFLSKAGTLVTNVLLGTRLKDMTSGYQALSDEVVALLINYPFRSKAHFYQTEVRYLLRHKKQVEIPIHYSSPSKRIQWSSISNALRVLGYYWFKRITFSSKQIK
jgi:dolichol-phosphate mannosyltransferase